MLIVQNSRKKEDLEMALVTTKEMRPQFEKIAKNLEKGTYTV